MKRGEKLYIWQDAKWPALRYDLAALSPQLAEVHRARGHLLGRLAHLGLAQRDQATAQVLTQDVLKTSEIEGERLNPDAVRSSVARHLGLDYGALPPADRHVDGVVQMALDATAQNAKPLTVKRLIGWQAALFPTGYSGLKPVRTGGWRDDKLGPMQVVSGGIGRQRVHFEAPPAKRLGKEMQAFLKWFEAKNSDDPVLRAGLAHLWFVTVHPFDDGNGRIARAICDLALARADGEVQRFYSLSAQIQRERRAYYEQLERTQKGTLDVTPWLQWFLACLLRAVQGAEQTLSNVLDKATFWQRWSDTAMNARQIKVLNRLLDGFEGKLSSSKYAALAKCSADTALRDLNELVATGVLHKASSGGRSTSYEIAPPPTR